MEANTGQARSAFHAPWKNTLELAKNALQCNANKTILQTSFPPQGLFYQMHDEENGKEKGKKDDVKHCPEVEKKVSPALRCPP